MKRFAAMLVVSVLMVLWIASGDRMSAERAYQMGMVNRLFAREALETGTYALAAAIARQPRMGLALTKQAINHVEDLQGKRTAMDAVFAWHHFAHAHNELLSGDKLGGYDALDVFRRHAAQALTEDAPVVLREGVGDVKPFQ